MKVSERPKIKIPFTSLDKIIELVGILMLIAFWFYTITNYNQLPDIIPTHFGAEGKPDGFGEKWMIFLETSIGTVLYIGLSILSFYPNKFNYLVEITEANAEKQYTLAVKMIRIMKISVLLVFFLIAIQTVRLAMNLPEVFGKWILILLISLVFGPLFYFLIQSSKNS